MMDRAAKTGLSNLAAKVKAAVVRAVVRTTKDPGGVITAALEYLEMQPDGVEVFQPQGLYFRPPATSEALGFAPTANASALVCGLAFDRDTTPSEGGLSEGEGGLYYAGNYAVFLASDGTVHLGAKVADDWVPLDSAVQAELTRIKGDIQAIVDLLGGSSAPPWIPVPMDGGAALQTAAATALAAVPSDPGTTKSTTTRVQS